MNKKLKLVGLAALFAIAFWLGRLSASYRVITYSVDGNRIAVHLDLPTYGLPMAEYKDILSEFRGGFTNKAITDMESFLDTAVQDAEYRRPLLRGEDLKRLDKSLAAVARYRGQYPRPLNQGNGFYWTADKQAELDKFLAGFTNQTKLP